MPDVTVLMAVYNGMPFLEYAIESILNQSFDDFEFVIVNDKSSDNTRDVVLGYNDPRILLIDNDRNLGQTLSLNKGLKQIRNRFIIRMDADDISHPKRIDVLKNFLDANEDVVAVGSCIKFIDNMGNMIGKHKKPISNLAIRWMQFFSNPIACGAVMFRKDIIWDELGGFDSEIRFAQDWELWSRIPPHYELANVPESLLYVRKHPNASTAGTNPILEEEEKSITRLNIERIFGKQTVDDNCEILLSKKVDNPKKLIDILEFLYTGFCDLFPLAKADEEVIEILARQYLGVLYYSRIHHLPKAIPIFLQSIMKTKQFQPIVTNVFKQLAHDGPSHIRYWLYRSLLGKTI